MADAEQGHGADGSGVPPPQPDPKAMQQQAAGKRLQQTQAQVNEVVDIMRVNVDKVLERDQKLSELDQRADHLQAGASQFEASAGKLKRKFWWKNCKMMIILGVVIALVLVVLGVWIAQNLGGGQNEATTVGPNYYPQPNNPYYPPQPNGGSIAPDDGGAAIPPGSAAS
ncbi:vesicle-associated membrane protein 3-like isoform X2 [Watersipora subatra]|uniref:vesicle-associated membrane protein 3-like isoform X2 n=1 Tax=Watersipora subatra TaxID=2589382 RepID=UPI00355C67DB